MASVNKAELERLYVVEQRSIPDVGKALSLTYYAARQALIAAGIPLRSRADGVRAAADKLGKHMVGKKRVFTEDWKKNINTARQAHADQHARGTRINSKGYVEFTRGPNKGRPQHRVIMEQKLGEKLPRSVVVHHRDEQRTHNTDDNLEVMTRAAHTSHHHRKGSYGKR